MSNLKGINFDKNKDTVYSLVVQVTVIRVQCICMYINIYIYIIPRRTLGHFFLPSAPRQPHRHFQREVCKTRQIYVRIFISKCFLCSDVFFCLGIFTRKLGGKPEICAEKSGIRQKLFETCFCTEQHEKTIQIFISLGFFWA